VKERQQRGDGGLLRGNFTKEGKGRKEGRTEGKKEGSKKGKKESMGQTKKAERAYITGRKEEIEEGKK
jgi:hypothetical protein